MLEIEIKARFPVNPVREWLVKNGGKQLKNVIQHDVFFTMPNRDFLKTDEILRVRLEKKEGREKVVVTYKGPKIDRVTKSRLEINIQVDSFESAVELFLQLGLRKTGELYKEREVWLLEDLRVMLDKVRGLGEFVEIEAPPANEEKLTIFRDRIMQLLSKIGIPEERLERRSYFELISGVNAGEKSTAGH